MSDIRIFSNLPFNDNIIKTTQANLLTVEQYKELLRKSKESGKILDAEIVGDPYLLNENKFRSSAADFEFNHQMMRKAFSFGKLRPQYYKNGITGSSSVDMLEFVHDSIDQESDWKIFQEILKEIFGDIKTVAESLTSLADVNSVDENFLPKLAYLLEYSYKYDLPHSTNRDIIKRWLWLKKQKGRDSDVLNAADFANNPNWVKSTMLVPTTEYPRIEIDRNASIYYPVDFLFTHNLSTFSETHRFANSRRWRDGIIVVELNELTQYTREAIKEVLPAGLKVFFDTTNEMKGDGTGHSVPFRGWWFLLDYVIEDFLVIDDGGHGHCGDRESIDFIRSGGQELWPHYEKQDIFTASMLPLYGKYPAEYAANLMQMLERFKSSYPTEAIITDPTTQLAIEIANRYLSDKDKATFFDILHVPADSSQKRFGAEVERFDRDFLIEGPKRSPYTTKPGDNLSYFSGEYISDFVIHKMQNGEFDFSLISRKELEKEFLQKSLKSFLDSFGPWTDNPIHSISYDTSPVDVVIENRRMPRYDDDRSTYSGGYARSGIYDGAIIEARHTEILPTDFDYPVSFIEEKYPMMEEYGYNTMDDIQDTEDFLCIDPILYRDVMKYRGPISYVFVGETEHPDYISPDNPNQTFKENTLSDWIISKNSEVFRLHEMTLNDLYQDMEHDLVDFASITLDKLGGRAEFIAPGKRDYFRDDYTYPSEREYFTSYGILPFSECLLRERLTTDEEENGNHEFLWNLSLDSDCFGTPLSEMALDSDVESYNRVYHKPISEVSATDIINPSREHKKHLAKDTLLFNYRQPFSEKHLEQDVNILEPAPF